MVRKAFGMTGALLAVVLIGVALAPSAQAATTYHIDVTRTIHGYTIHVVGDITIDDTARTISGVLTVTVTDPAGNVVFVRTITFSTSFGSSPGPVTLVLPGTGISLTLAPSVAGGWTVTTSLTPVSAPTPTPRASPPNVPWAWVQRFEAR